MAMQVERNADDYFYNCNKLPLFHLFFAVLQLKFEPNMWKAKQQKGMCRELVARG